MTIRTTRAFARETLGSRKIAHLAVYLKSQCSTDIREDIQEIIVHIIAGHMVPEGEPNKQFACRLVE